MLSHTYVQIFDLQSWYIREIVVELLYSSCTLSNVSSKSDYTLVLFSSFLLVIHNSYMRWVHQHEGSLSPLRYSLNLSDIEVLDCSLNGVYFICDSSYARELPLTSAVFVNKTS